MLYLTDEVITPGAAVRSVMFTDASELTAPTGTDPVAELTTNRGTVLCAAGSMAYKDDFSAIKILGPDGWKDADM